MRVDAAQRELLRRIAALDYPAPSFRHAGHLDHHLLLIRERMDALGDDHGWPGFRAADPYLSGSPKTLLEHWYPGAQAFSPEAKHSFRLPA